MKRKARGSYGYGHSYGYGGHDQQDRLTPLSDDLLISIFSYVDTKLAVQSSILSKRYINLWTLLPVLNFNCEQQEEHPYALDPFDYDVTSDYFFIHKVFALRNASILIDRLSIKVTDHKTLDRVFHYALLHRVPDVSIDCLENVDKYRPISYVKSNNSLMSLSLKGMMSFGYFPCFDGLVSLRLERVKIVEVEPFSSFPNLKELFLVNCKMEIGLTGLEVVASRLLRLTISSCFHNPVAYMGLVLLTPCLELLELEGLIPVDFEALDDLSVLHTVHMDFLFSYNARELSFEQQKVNLIGILGSLKHAECVHLSPSTVELLSLCESMLAKEHCPFEDLKFLNLIPPPNEPVPQLDSCVATYLLKDYPKANVKALPRSVGVACTPTKPLV